MGAKLGVVFSGAIVACGCSGGGSGTGAITIPPGDFRYLSVTPAHGAWVAADVIPTATFSKPLAPASVGSGDLVVRTRDGVVIAGEVKSDSARMTFTPSQPLAEGFYVLTLGGDVEAFDGSPLALVALAPVEFSVRGPAGTWSNAVTLGAEPAPDANLVVAADAIGGVSLAWLQGQDVMVADYDRDGGWAPAEVADRVTAQPADVKILLGRGAGTVILATVEGDFAATPLLRVRTSRSTMRNRQRNWDGVRLFRIDLVGAPQVHVDATGRPFLLAGSRRLTRADLRVTWFDTNTMPEEVVGRPAEAFAIDGVYHGVRGDSMIAWTETSGPQRASYARVHRSGGWDAATTLPVAPHAGGVGADGNAWLFVADGPTRVLYAVQDAGRWPTTRPALPAGFGNLVARNRDVVQLDWRTDAGQETLLARHFDRLGQMVAETVLAGPTAEALRYVLFAGDPETEVLAVWRQGQGTRVSRLARTAGVLAWSAAQDWHTEHAPIPIERALVTTAAGRIGLTWVEDGKIATTFLMARRLAARPALNPRLPATATPLVDEQFLGTTAGALLVWWRGNRALNAQSLQ
jgi:hypothetical protein